MLKKIIVIKIPQLTPATLGKIQGYSHNLVEIFDSLTEDCQQKIPDADAILTSFMTPIDEDFIRSCKNLRYIGIFGSSLKNIDMEAIHSAGIRLTNVTHYCDQETAELLLTEVLMMARGLSPLSWKNIPTTLNGKRLGIIGLGGVGQSMKKLAVGVGMHVSHFSPNKSDQKDFLNKSELLNQSDILSLHVPPFTQVLDTEDFKKIRPGSILISSCQGRVWNSHALQEWLENESNRFILDGFAFSQLSDDEKTFFQNSKNVRISPLWAYRTSESLQRIEDRFIANLDAFAKSQLP